MSEVRRIVSRNEIKIENFYKYVNPEPNTGCWLWSGYTMPNGYGHFSIGTKSHLAHRISFLYFKEDPQDLEVCHKCDNPYCVNPDHLFKGTRQDNVNDMLSKNRQRGQFQRKKICKRGHLKDDENTYQYKNHFGCKKCRALINKLIKDKKKASLKALKEMLCQK